MELLTPARGGRARDPARERRRRLRRLREQRRALPRIADHVTSVSGSTVSLADAVNGEPSETEAELVVVRTRLRVNDGAAARARRRRARARRRRRLLAAAAADPRGRSTRTSRCGGSTRAGSTTRGDGRVLIVDVVVLAKYVPNPSGPAAGDRPGLPPAARGAERRPRPERRAGRRGRRAPRRGARRRLRRPSRSGRSSRCARCGGRSRSAPTARCSSRTTRCAGADALVTAKVLAAAIARRPFDLVIAGVESTDAATGTMPMALAELLGVPAVTFARARGPDGPTASRSSARRRRATTCSSAGCRRS